jgi:hypothetical protein
MAGPQFPDVPMAPGVPSVQRSIQNRGADTQTALPANQITATAGVNRWGIYTKGGVKALDPDSVSAINYSFEYHVADFPIEAGGFESYDKVAMPFDAMVIMTKGGKLADRRAFLSALEDIKGDRELYNVVTPERTYLNVNIVGARIDRTREQGAGLISVEVRLREIRENVTTAFSSTQDAASADVKNDGAVQTTPPTAATAPPIVPKFALTTSDTLAPVSTLAKAVPSFTPASVIPLQAFPAQTLAVQLGGQLTQITTYQKRTGMFLDLLVNNVLIVTGAACLDRVPILRNAYSGFVGNLAFVDTQGLADPSFDGLADRFALVWGT